MPDDAGAQVAGIVLAAGSSTRLGRNKLLLELQGEPLVRRTVRRAVAAGLDPVVVVVGHEAECVIAALVGIPCRPIMNPEHHLGQSRSVRAGVESVPPDAAAAVVLLADMPLVTREMIAALVERYRERRAPLVLSDYDGVPAPPTLYDRRLFAELGVARGEGCGRGVVRRHRHEAEVLAWPAAALQDVDAPEDLERVLALVECVPISLPSRPT